LRVVFILSDRLYLALNATTNVRLL